MLCRHPPPVCRKDWEVVGRDFCWRKVVPVPFQNMQIEEEARRARVLQEPDH